MADQPSLDKQAQYWDSWNLAARESMLPSTSKRQGNVLEAAVAAMGRRDLCILDVGCGTGWACARLRPYGRVTGTDMTESTLARARERLPDVEFLCGDLFAVPLPLASFDVVVTFEVLSHVANQQAFVDRLAALLKPGGLLVLSTQNRPVISRWSFVAAPDPGQLRHWVDRHELRALLKPGFEDIAITSHIPDGDSGFLRLVNSPKLNWPVEAMVGVERVRHWKEVAMLGRTLVATGKKRLLLHSL